MEEEVRRSKKDRNTGWRKELRRSHVVKTFFIRSKRPLLDLGEFFHFGENYQCVDRRFEFLSASLKERKRYRFSLLF